VDEAIDTTFISITTSPTSLTPIILTAYMKAIRIDLKLAVRTFFKEEE
jgi:hypothetical protein